MYKKYQLHQAFSLIELLLAVSLGLIMTALMLQIYSSNRAVSRTQEGLIQIQQNGRFADYFISRDVRMAGYQGCSNQQNITATNLLAAPIADADLQPINSVRGYEATGGAWTPGLPAQVATLAKANTDVLFVRFSSPLQTTLSQDMLTKSDNINVNNRITISANDYLVINDCGFVDLFRASNDTSNTNIRHIAGDNTSDELSKAYSTTAHVSHFESYGYYIADTTRVNTEGNPIPALFRIDINGNSIELIEGVEDMQIRYGLDTDDDGSIDQLVPANVVSAVPGETNSWINVKAIHISLLLNSINHASNNRLSYTYNGNTVENPPDNLMRREWNIDVTIRNRA